MSPPGRQHRSLPPPAPCHPWDSSQEGGKSIPQRFPLAAARAGATRLVYVKASVPNAAQALGSAGDGCCCMAQKCHRNGPFGLINGSARGCAVMKQMPTGSSGTLQLNHNTVLCCFLMFNWYLKCNNFLSQPKLKRYWRDIK